MVLLLCNYHSSLRSENKLGLGSSGISNKMKGAVRRAATRRNGQWGREGKKGGGDECKTEEFQGGEEGEERPKERGLVFYVEATSGEVTKHRIRALNPKGQNQPHLVIHRSAVYITKPPPLIKWRRYWG